MLTIPLQVDPTQFDLFVVLNEEGLERIKKYDPAELVLEKLGPRWSGTLRLRAILICYASPEEAKELIAARTSLELGKLVNKLLRGWSFQPGKGASDSPYQRPQHN